MADDGALVKRFLAATRATDAKLARALDRLDDEVHPALAAVLGYFATAGADELDEEERGLARRVLTKLHHSSPSRRRRTRRCASCSGDRAMRAMTSRILLIAVLCSCGRPAVEPGRVASAPPPGRESRPAGRAAPTDGVRVQIIQAGRGPRRALRYRFRADRLGVMTTFFDMDMAYRSGEGATLHTPSPPMEMDVELTGLTVERGVARASHRIDRIDVVTSPSDVTDEKTRAALRQRLQGMVGMTGTMALDDRGRLHEMSWNMPDTLAPEIRAMLVGFSESGDDMVVPLPEEPVGVGAEWYSVKETPLMGMKLANTSRVKLVAMDGDRIRLSSSTDVSAGRQPVTFPGLPAGTTAELLSCDGGGAAEIDLDLGWMAPARLAVQSRTELVMELTTGGRTETVTVQARVTMETKRR